MKLIDELEQLAREANDDAFNSYDKWIAYIEGATPQVILALCEVVRCAQELSDGEFLPCSTWKDLKEALAKLDSLSK